jgi:hypothetical protein
MAKKKSESQTKNENENLERKDSLKENLKKEEINIPEPKRQVKIP